MRRGDLSSSMFCSLFVHDPNARPMSVSNAFKKKEKTLFRREIRATAVPALRPPRQEQETVYISLTDDTKKKGGGGLKKREKESLFLSSETETVHLVLPLSAAARQTQHILAGERKRDALDLIPSHLSR